MISIESVEKYCKNYAEIENYDKAVNDITQIWECHHRLEVAPFSGKKVSMDFLKDQGIYYNQPPEALIFLTKAEHNFLTHKGKLVSKETKQKMSLTKKGKKGHKFSEETRQKLSNAHKGKPKSDKHRESLSKSLKGKPKSEEAKRKMSESRSKMGWKIDPTTGKRVWYRKEN